MLRDFIYKLRQYGFRKFSSFVCWEIIMVFRHIFLQSYSQNNEDLIIDSLLHHKRYGFYIDVGAYDPIRFSNTMRFYKRGWRGINIEPDIQQFHRIRSLRKRDINLNIGISAKTGKLTYWMINPKTLSTFSRKQASIYKKEGYRIVRKVNIQVTQLSNITEKYCPLQSVDFMSVDVEGFELDVLKSNNWNSCRPRVLCIELSFGANELAAEIKGKKALIHYIESNGYTFVSKTATNYIYADKKTFSNA